jgi:hypothetical protein
MAIFNIIFGTINVALSYNLEQNGNKFVFKTNDEVNETLQLFVIFSESGGS